MNPTAIVCLEIFTDGEKPYTGMDNAAVINKVQAGYRVPKPPACTAEFYAMLLSCWNAKPKRRMTFSEIATTLDPMVPGGTAITAITFNASRAFSAPGYEGGSKANPYYDADPVPSDDESPDEYVDMSGGHADANVKNTKAKKKSKKSKKSKTGKSSNESESPKKAKVAGKERKPSKKKKASVKQTTADTKPTKKATVWENPADEDDYVDIAAESEEEVFGFAESEEDEE